MNMNTRIFARLKVFDCYFLSLKLNGWERTQNILLVLLKAGYLHYYNMLRTSKTLSPGHKEPDLSFGDRERISKHTIS